MVFQVLCLVLGRVYGIWFLKKFSTGKFDHHLRVKKKLADDSSIIFKKLFVVDLNRKKKHSLEMNIICLDLHNDPPGRN